MRTLILATILVATALSGCLADPEGQSTTSSSSATTDSTSSTNSTSTTGATTGSAGPTTTSVAAENTPPTANLTADVENGTAPLNVTFTIDGTDEDGDELSWTLDADGDGTEDYNGTGVPTAVVHEFTKAGEYTAALTITDGTDNASAEFTVTVEAPAVAGPNICHRPTAATGGLYSHSEGGTWIFRESNSIPGLQVGNTHPTGSNAATLGFAKPEWATCVQGDQMLF